MTKIFLKFIFVLCAVILLHYASANIRDIRQNRWPWDNGNNKVNQRASITTTENPYKNLTDDQIKATIRACDPYKPQVPDFSKPGRRLSAVKCLETIWDINYRKNFLERRRNCSFELQAAKGITVHGVIRGKAAMEGEFPHMGAVGWKAAQGTWIFKCGATLVSAKFVLTAGHCTKVSDTDTSVADAIPKIVRLGDTNILDKGSNWHYAPPVDADISKIIKHPSYDSPMRYNDIAIMEFEMPVKFSYQVHPACLWGKTDTSALGSQVTVTGWGVLETGGLNISPTLQAAVIDQIQQQQCDSLLRTWCNRLWCGLRESQICAGKLEGGVDACQGDSGGPLQVKLKLPPVTKESMYYVIGVTSFGFGCARANTPGVYTRVSSYIDWIEQVVWGRN